MKAFLQSGTPRLLARFVALAALIALVWLGTRGRGPADPDPVVAHDTGPADTQPEDAPIDPLIPDPLILDTFRGELPLPDRTFSDPEHPLMGWASEWLQDRQGSYESVSDLFRSEEDPSLDLESDWILPRLFPDRAFPSLRMRVSRDPESGEYRLIGGGVAIPGTGWELRYEQDPDREERRGVLQWRTTF